MAPEIDVNNWSSERVEAYNQWILKKADEGKAQGKHHIIDANTHTVNVSLIDGEPLVEFVDFILAPREHKIYVGEKLADRLKADGVITEADIVKPSVTVSR